MAETHLVKIVNFAFDPAEITVDPGDSIIWQNEDFSPHTADGKNGEFSTGNINPSEQSNAIFFPESSNHSGISYFCMHHPQMLGSVIVNSASNPAADPPAVSDVDDFASEEWSKISKHVLNFWIYDMCDDFEHAIAVNKGEDRDKLVSEWDSLIDDWHDLSGVQDNPTDRVVLESIPKQELYSFGRLVRRATLRNRSLISRFPDPKRGGAQSNDPFGKAITIFSANSETRESYDRQVTYVSSALRIEVSIDMGNSVTQQMLDAYHTAKSALSLKDYENLAKHQVVGLKQYFGGDGYNDEIFAEGAWRMTYTGEWDDPSYVGWHWLKWIEGYLGVKNDGKIPDLVQLPQLT